MFDASLQKQNIQDLKDVGVLPLEICEYIEQNTICTDDGSWGTWINEIENENEIEWVQRRIVLFTSKGKPLIVTIDAGEANWYENEVHIRIHNLCEKYSISADKFIFITNDAEIENRYNEWFKTSNYKKKINVLSYPMLFQRYISLYYKEGYTGYDLFDIKKYKNPTKKFLCLIGKETTERSLLWNWFNMWKEIKDCGYVSNIAKNIVLPNSYKTSKKDVLEGRSYAGIDSLEQYYEDTYFSIVPENTVDHGEKWVTEKITKVLYHGHPFIVVGTHGILKLLKSWGFETFPELFDESYDDIEDWRERIEYIKKEIIKFCLLKDDKELSKLYDSVYEKCVHNQKTLLNLKIPGEELLSKLKNIVETNG